MICKHGLCHVGRHFKSKASLVHVGENLCQFGYDIRQESELLSALLQFFLPATEVLIYSDWVEWGPRVTNYLWELITALWPVVYDIWHIPTPPRGYVLIHSWNGGLRALPQTAPEQVTKRT